MKQSCLLIILLITLFLPQPLTCYATSGPASYQKNLPDFKADFEQARELMNSNLYADALPIFLKLHKDDQDNCNLNFLIGYCYVKNNQKVLALPFLQKSTLNTKTDYNDNNYKERSAPVFSFFYLGQVFQWQNRFDAAMDNYLKFKEFLLNKSGKLINQKNFEVLNDVNRHIDQVNNAIKFAVTPLKVQFVKIPYINTTAFSSYGTQLNSEYDHLFLTRDKIIDKSKSKADIFQMRKTQTSWSRPELIQGNINSQYNDRFSSISEDGKFFLFSSDRKGNYNIYYALKDGNKWTEPYDNLSINTSYNEYFASISRDGTKLFFVSDMPGGFGGTDIYKIEKRNDGSWSEPENLGFLINTPYNDDTPWISDDGSYLYFSSEGHSSIGGFDVFVSQFKNNMWQDPENVGIPVNSPADELYFKKIAKKGLAIFSSNRKNDGYLFETLCIKYAESEGIKDNIFGGPKENDSIERDQESVPIQKSDTQAVPDLTGNQNQLASQDSSNQHQWNTVSTNQDSTVKQQIDPVQQSENIVQQPKSVDTSMQLRNQEQNPVIAEQVQTQEKQNSEQDTLKIEQINGQLQAPEQQNPISQETQQPVGTEKNDLTVEVEKIDVGKDSLEIDQPIIENTKQNIPEKIANSGNNVKETEITNFQKQENAIKDSINNAKKIEKMIAEQEKQQQLKNEKLALDRQRKILAAIERARKDSVARLSKPQISHISNTKPAIKSKYQISGYLNYCDTSSIVPTGRYTVQVGAGFMKVRYFTKLDDKKICFGRDGMPRFIVGSYASKATAEALAEDIRKTGYLDAWVPEIDGKRCACEDNDLVKDVIGENNSSGKANAYTIQVGAGNMKIGYFKNLRQVRICNGDDGIQRFVFGHFSTQEDAEKVRAKLVEMGYKDAWIPEIDANRCSTILNK
jgi:hypothetical protein